ncbi:unnamed protein product (macronuclear) [Paramecium tetraurelia]|uniref:t-SNARE coiled-coil homology domain-containing protein n=1 Tax=Paramecium tetraurelia TaxID=5888 RepID=A0DBB8_PARTE|nr:uncharacterized protein GSPATT00015229001 [Paramecium tetraurelia]CAK80335.1 unnamed protein product [Paramecium tetraurelia]|eukprot:XP_001447732.1 hypothetical protein (macronuclear) [Paramecium tetraurelia strain d4-2]
MQFFQIPRMQKEQSKRNSEQLDVFELKELGQQDGEGQLTELTQKAQARIQHFEKVCHDLNEKIIHCGSQKEMDHIQKFVKEAQNDLDQMEKIIQNMGSIQLQQKSQISQKQQTQQKLIKVFQNSKENFKKIKNLIDQLDRSHQKSQAQAKQPIKDRHGDNQINVQLLDDEFDYGYDEKFIQSRNKQIMEIAQIIQQLNEMMQEGARMIKEQGEKIQIISNGIKEAGIKTEKAGEEMKKAAKAQQGSNDRILYFCGIITLLVVIIVLMYSASSRTYPDTNQQQSQN